MIFKLGTESYRHLVAGLDSLVPLANGQQVPAINFDNAATTPPFNSVLKDLVEFAPTYSSIHRGTGYKSIISSKLYEEARAVIANFVKADLSKDSIIFVKNTTEAINKLSYRLWEPGKKEVVLSTQMEHHSNDLPWRKKFTVDYIQTDEKGRLSLSDLKAKLEKYKGKVKLVAVTGASNVTGYVNPIHKIAELAHQYQAKIIVDGAQLIPHASIDMQPYDSLKHIDYLAFSAHKMYAPFGIGVLIGPRETFFRGEPEYVGGGTVSIVTPDAVYWDEPPHKEEAGTPNIMGVLALVSAIKSLHSIGMKKLERQESNLLEYALARLVKVPDLEIYSDLNHKERIGVIPFNIKGMSHSLAARVLSAEAGIAVRNGCFCAQPYIQRLLRISPQDMVKYMKPGVERPGLVRISFGLYNEIREIDTLVQMLRQISDNKRFYLDKYAGYYYNYL